MIVIADKIAGKISARNAIHLVCNFFTYVVDPIGQETRIDGR